MSTTKALSLLVLLLFVPLVYASDQCPINSIYQFGDSIADTGNLIRNGPVGARSHAANYPYGQTYFHRATGRCSNGPLMIDYLARRLGLPLLNPYLNGNTKSLSYKNGVNFAVSGSTALNSSFFTSRNLHVPATNTPLSTQLAWFKTHLRSTCHGSSSDCLKQSLFMVGEIGGNDYNSGFFQGKPMEEIRSYKPHVVGAITAGAREVIRAGAVNMVVPGNFPVGCFPIYLTSFPVKDPKAYDDKGCLKHLNEFAMDHNNQLQEAIASLRKEFPDVAIVYGDYYNAFQSVLRSGRFDKSVQLSHGTWNKNSNSCGVAWILRDCHGRLKHFRAKRYPLLRSSLETEAAALSWAVFCVTNLGYKNVVFHSDNSDVIKAVRDPETWPRLQNFSGDILGRCKNGNYSFAFSGRSTNACADALAKDISGYELYHVYLNVFPPSWLLPHLIKDNECISVTNGSFL